MSPASSIWSSSDSDSDDEDGAGATALVLRRHGSSTAAVARALVRVRFLHEERESLQQRLQVRLLLHVYLSTTVGHNRECCNHSRRGRRIKG